MDGDSSFEKLIALGYEPQKEMFSGVIKIKDPSLYDDYKQGGLLENTLLIFEGKKSKGDYHQQFDHQVFQK